MLHVFNRTKLLVTWDLDHLSQVREALMEAGIECLYRSQSMRNPAFFSENKRVKADCSRIKGRQVEYKLYVHKKELDRAKALL